METQGDKIQDMVIEVAMSIFIFYYFLLKLETILSKFYF